MKAVLRISIILNIVFATYILVKGSELITKDFFVQSRMESKQTQEENTSTKENTALEESIETARTEEMITCDTVYMILQYDVSTGREDRLQELLPTSWIGMNRNQLIEWIEEYNLQVSLKDREQGFLSMELVSFSEEEVRVRKRVESMPKEVTRNQESVFEAEERTYYREEAETLEEPIGQLKTVSGNETEIYGCILVQDGLLTVYDGQRRHVILYTDIPLFYLSQEVQQEILDGKNVYSEEELYNLLESYSS